MLYLAVFIFILTCSITCIESRRILLEKVKSNGKCEGDVLKAVNASAFSCMSSCDAEPQCDVANIMEEQGRCELLSDNASFPAATKTADSWSCYNKPKMDFCATAEDPDVVFPCCVLGRSRCVPARSCLHLTTTCPSYAFESGLYWILGPLNAIQMFCDMETYGGGWTKFANVDTMSGSYPDASTNFFDDITMLDRAGGGFFRLSRNGLRNLRGIIQFTQMRVFCYKPSINRTIHIATTKSALGYAVVAYMTGETDVQPAACNSFTILPEDTSRLSRGCSNWQNGQWGSPNLQRLYDHGMFVPSTLHVLPGIMAGSESRFDCDDFKEGDKRGKWAFFVR